MSNPILTRSNVRVVGNQRSARTLVFAHGFGSNQTSWRFVLDAFEPDYRIVLFDLMGHGESDPAAFSNVRHGTLQGFADDLVAISDELKISGAVAIGHSASGVVAAMASQVRPALFKRFVMIGTSPRYVNAPGYIGGFDQEAVDAILVAMSTDFGRWLRDMAPQAMRNPEQPLLASEFAQSIARMNPATAITTMRSILNMDHRRTLAKVAAPVLVLQPNSDVFVPPEVGAFLLRTMGDVTLREIDASGHFPHMTNPRVVVDAIREFLGVSANPDPGD